MCGRSSSSSSSKQSTNATDNRTAAGEGAVALNLAAAKLGNLSIAMTETDSGAVSGMEAVARAGLDVARSLAGSGAEQARVVASAGVAQTEAALEYGAEMGRDALDFARAAFGGTLDVTTNALTVGRDVIEVGRDVSEAALSVARSLAADAQSTARGQGQDAMNFALQALEQGNSISRDLGERAFEFVETARTDASERIAAAQTDTIKWVGIAAAVAVTVGVLAR